MFLEKNATLPQLQRRGRRRGRALLLGSTRKFKCLKCFCCFLNCFIVFKLFYCFLNYFIIFKIVLLFLKYVQHFVSAVAVLKGYMNKAEVEVEM